MEKYWRLFLSVLILLKSSVNSRRRILAFSYSINDIRTVVEIMNRDIF